jgi:hypothetical protein
MSDLGLGCVETLVNLHWVRSARAIGDFGGFLSGNLDIDVQDGS